MSSKKSRDFRVEFKLEAVCRMESGENVCALSRELGVARKLLYEWRSAFRSGGVSAFRRRGRPRKGEVVVGSRSSLTSAPTGAATDLASARRRIAELERKVGQQALAQDFFEQALRRIEGLRHGSDGNGGMPSTGSSGRGRRGKAD